jgi:hypothetical protein
MSSVDALATPTFELRTPDSAGSGGVFGVWESLAARDNVTFDVAGTAQAVAHPEWRVSLPADMRQASASLSEAEIALAATASALPVAQDHLVRLARSAPDQFVGLDAAAGDVSFGLGDDLAGLARATLDFVSQLQEPRAEVRTSIDRACVGWTIVDGVGRLHTMHATSAGAEHAALHLRAVGLVLESRATLVRTFTLALSTAVLVSATLASLGGVLLAVPAAWRLINQIQAEFRSAARVRSPGLRTQT